MDFEGGTYGVITFNDGHQDPINLPSEFEVHGLQLKFKAKISEDFGSHYMWGIVIELMYIKKWIKDLICPIQKFAIESLSKKMR